MSKSHHAPNEIRTFPQKRYAERRHWLDGVKILAGCADCKLWGPPEVLQFDHVRGEKKFNIGPAWNQGRRALEDEIAKCEVVCANCHAIRTKQRSKELSTGAPPFVPFQKIPRLSREIVVTEKIDGTNGAVWVDGDGDVWAASRGRWITPEDDNFGFAAWVAEHSSEFRERGAGVLFGEWWGAGIQRGYGLAEKRFSLFNVGRWVDRNADPIGDTQPLADGMEWAPQCCHVVPILHRGVFDTDSAEAAIWRLKAHGSIAAPGFMNPEGIVVYHEASGALFKRTCEHDDEPKNAHVKKDKPPRPPRDRSKGGRRVAQIEIGFADRRRAV